MTKDLFYLARPYQWVKNVFVLMPLFFGKQLMDSTTWLPLSFAVAAFCLASSGVYCLNDICDAESDRMHPDKCRRPIASGRVSQMSGYVMMAICWLLAIFFSLLAGMGNAEMMLTSVGIVAGYIVINIAYCLKLKKYSIIDLLIVASGFLLRLLEGGLVSGVDLSHWLIMMAFLLALFIATAKRRDDVVAFERNGIMHRTNVARYNTDFINITLGIIASITMVCYIMYTLSPDVIERMGSDKVYFTALIVLAGLIRYLQLAIVDSKSGNPIKVMSQDRFIQLCIAAWTISFFVLLYF